jgi:hypothetical protein
LLEEKLRRGCTNLLSAGWPEDLWR